jgi:hypothetical protein
MVTGTVVPASAPDLRTAQWRAWLRELLADSPASEQGQEKVAEDQSAARREVRRAGVEQPPR